jgi:hypothetical protein
MTRVDSSRANGATRRSISRYDLVLAIIPAALIGPALLASVLGMALETGLLLGGVVGGAALLDAVVLNPPRGRRKGGKTA